MNNFAIERYGILHIRKCGGTAIRNMLSRTSHLENEFPNYLMFDHFVSLKGLWRSHPNHKAIFVIRDPIERFVSGFNGRLRKGNPTFSTPWTKQEEEIFKVFSTPNDIAEMLNSKWKIECSLAKMGMLSVRHINTYYADWLHSPQFLKKNIEKIGFIANLNSLERDSDYLKKLLEIDASLSLPSNPVEKNAAPADQSKFLSARAKRNLKNWYKNDEEIIKWCKKWRKSNGFE